jgi:hypothetical protein
VDTPGLRCEAYQKPPSSAEGRPTGSDVSNLTATKRQELDARFVSIVQENWRKEEKIAVAFKFERPRLEEPKEVSP